MLDTGYPHLQDTDTQSDTGGVLMTPVDPRLAAPLDELANALQTVTVVTDALRRDLRAHVQEADTLHQAVSRAVTAVQTIRKEEPRRDPPGAQAQLPLLPQASGRDGGLVPVLSRGYREHAADSRQVRLRPDQ